MTTAQTVTAVTAIASGVLVVVAAADPGGFLTKPEVQQAVVGVFAAAVPLGIYLWSYFHHQNARG